MNTLLQSLHSLGVQLRNMSRREQAAAAWLGATLSVVLFLELQDVASALEGRVEESKLNAGNIAARVADGDARALAAVEKAFHHVKETTIIAPTPELAALEAHALVNRYVSNAGIENAVVSDRLEHDDKAGSAGRITVSVSGSHDVQKIETLLRSLAAERRSIFVSGLRETPGQSFELELLAPYILTGGGE